MTDLSRLVRSSPEVERRARMEHLVEGIVATTPADATEAIFVRIPSRHPRRRWGPCPWEPRIVDESNFGLPSRGDRCLVAFSEEGEPWVIAWWPYE